MANIVRWMASICRASRPPQIDRPSRPHQIDKGMDKRIARVVWIKIFREFLTNQECCRVYRTCHTLQNLLCGGDFGLVIGKCRQVWIRNTLQTAGASLLFRRCDYDPRAECLLTADVGRCPEAGLKLWDRRGEMVQKLRGNESDNLACLRSLHLCTDNQTACGLYPEGQFRIWNLKTGMRLDGHCQNPDAFCPDLETRSFVCGSPSGSVELMEGDEQEKYTKRLLGKHDRPVAWVSQIPKIGRVYSCSSDGVLKVWDRITGKCVAEAGGILPTPAPIVDPDTQQLFCCKGDDLLVFGPDFSSPKCFTYYHILGRNAKYSALHYDPTKKMLFAAFNYKQPWIGRPREERTYCGMVICDVARNEMRGLGAPGVIKQIDFDPKTNILFLTSHSWVEEYWWRPVEYCNVHLWDIETGKEMRRLPEFELVKWDKSKRLLIGSCRGQIAFFDYSSSAPKPESKEDFKEQPKKE